MINDAKCFLTCWKCYLWCYDLYYVVHISQIRGAITVVSLLGITWIVGPFSIGWARLPFHYLFTLTTPLQGLIIFMVRVLQHTESKNSWINFFQTGSLRQRPKTPQSSFHTNSSINMNTTTNSNTGISNGMSPKSSFTSSGSSGRKILTKRNSSGTPKSSSKRDQHLRHRNKSDGGNLNALPKQNSSFLRQLFNKKNSDNPNERQDIPTVYGLVATQPSSERPPTNSDVVMSMKDYWEHAQDAKIAQKLEKSPDGPIMRKSDSCTFTEFIERQQYFDNLLYADQSRRGLKPINGYPVMGIGQPLKTANVPPTMHLSEFVKHKSNPVIFSQDPNKGYFYHPYASRMLSYAGPHKFQPHGIPPSQQRQPFTHQRYSFSPSRISNHENKNLRHPNPPGQNFEEGGALPRTLSDYHVWRQNVNTLTEYSKEDSSLRRCISSDCLASGGPVWYDGPSSSCL